MTMFQRFVWFEYILKPHAVLDHLPASAYAMFVRFHEHPNSSHCGVWSYKSSYKKVFTAGGSGSANDNV